MNERTRKEEYEDGLKDGIPIGLGYFAVSFAFGIEAARGGMSPWIASLISLTNLTSAGQFAALPIIFSGSGFLEMALTQLVINLRYCLMSFSLSQKVDPSLSPAHRALMSFGVTDEIFGIGSARAGILSPYYQYGAMSVAVPGWVLGTLCGAALGNVLPAMLLSALGVAIYGMFLAIIIPPAAEERSVLFAVILAMAGSSLFAYVPVLNRVSSGFVIIIVTVIVSALAAVLAPVTEETEANDE